MNRTNASASDKRTGGPATAGRATTDGTTDTTLNAPPAVGEQVVIARHLVARLNGERRGTIVKVERLKRGWQVWVELSASGRGRSVRLSAANVQPIDR